MLWSQSMGAELRRLALPISEVHTSDPCQEGPNTRGPWEILRTMSQGWPEPRLASNFESMGGAPWFPLRAIHANSADAACKRETSDLGAILTVTAAGTCMEQLSYYD